MARPSNARAGTFRRLAGAGLALAAACGLGGCVLNGARVGIVADTARYPVSMTGLLPDAEGRNLRLGEALVPRGKLSTRATACSFVYGAVPATVELSRAVNEQVAAAAGEGVVHLLVEATDLGMGWAFPLAVLPFWPSCLAVQVTGDIVARRPPPPTVPAASAAPEPGS